MAHTELYSLVQARLERKNPDRAAEQRRKVEGDISTLEAAAADHGAGLFDLGYVSLDSVPAPMPTKFEPELDQAEAPAPPPVETSLGTTRPLTPRELIELRRRVENRLKTSGSDAAPERERILGRLVHELFRREGLGEGQVANLERNVLGIVQLWSEEEVSLRGGGESHESAERIDMLERRLSKLRNSLERTEQALHETQLRGTVDTGVASIFREVQGLSEYDDSFAMKKELMVSIFEANLELRERLDPGV